MRGLKRRGFVTPFANKKVAVEGADGNAVPAQAAASRPPTSTEAPDDGLFSGIDLDDDTEPATAPSASTAPTAPARRNFLRGRARGIAVKPSEEASKETKDTSAVSAPDSDVHVYEVFYAANSSRKHKQWVSGELHCAPGRLQLMDEDGKQVGTAFKVRTEHEVGDMLDTAGHNIEVLKRKQCSAAPPPPPPARRPKSIAKPAPQPEKKSAVPPPAPPSDASVRYTVNYAVNSSKKHKSWQPGEVLCLASVLQLFNEDGKRIAQTHKLLRAWEPDEEYDMGGFIVCFEAVVPEGGAPVVEVVREPVAKVSSLSTRGKFRGNGARGYLRLDGFCEECVPLARNADNKVVAYLDKPLSRKLRAHQKEGVQFLYDITSRPDGNYRGVVLADEMGLGKTLQCIALVEAHLKNRLTQVRKVVIVAPSSLVANWAREFKKWLPNASYRMQPTVLSPAEKKTYTVSKLRSFTTSDMCPVLLLSYEMMRSYADTLKGMGCDLLICDEGHRLKGFDTQIAAALQDLKARRKVLITGTPVQNNLVEYYALFDFVNPGLLGDRSSFRKKFVNAKPATSTSTSSSSSSDSTEEELKRLTSPYILRRTQASISSSLPPKTELLLFLAPSPLQGHLCREVLNALGPALDALQAIHVLKKCLIHPQLAEADLKGIVDMKKARAAHSGAGGKLQMVTTLLKQFREQKVKTVVVSSSVQVLNVIAAEMGASGLGPAARLDGSIPTAKRMPIVDTFNRHGSGSDVLLLSCKAGGVGLNLIGACRLILVDMDWNPANDLQAVARIWREGQERECRIYRLVVRGTLEERILQRQLVKLHLSKRMVAEDAGTKRSQWSLAEARRIFEYDASVPCTTFCAPGTTTDVAAQVLRHCSTHDPAVTPALVTYVTSLNTDDVTTPCENTTENDGQSSDCDEDVLSTPDEGEDEEDEEGLVLESSDGEEL